MKVYQKLGALCVALSLLFSGCSTGNLAQGEAEQLPAIETSGAPQEDVSAQVVSVMLPSSHQNVGQVLQNVANSQNIQLEIRLADNEPRYTAELVQAMEGEDRPDLYWLPGEFAVYALDASEYYPYNLAVPASGLLLESLASMVPQAFRLFNEEKVYALPVGAYAQGTLVNLPMLAALLGAEDLIALQRDLILCSYEEWQVMQQAIADYLVTPGRYQFSLGGNLYTMPSYRPSEAESLRGLWALATVGNTSYAENGLAAAFSAAYASPAAYLYSDPEMLNEFMQQPLQALYDEIEFETQHMVGHDGALSRGENFSLAREVTAEEAQELFENGSALLWKTDSSVALQIESENTSLAGNMFLIPTKLPFSDENVAGLNQLYSLGIDGYLAVAGGEEAGGAAGQLLVQMFTDEASMQAIQNELWLLPYTEYYPQSPLLRALDESIGIGEYYLMPLAQSSLDTTQQRLGDWIHLNLMSKSEWTEEDEANFFVAAQGMWGEIIPQTELEEETEDPEEEEETQ